MVPRIALSSLILSALLSGSAAARTAAASEVTTVNGKPRGAKATTSTTPAAATSTAAPPDAMAIAAAVFASLDLVLDPAKNTGCQWDAAIRAPRLGDYVAFLNGTLAASAPDDRQTIHARCGAYDPKASVFAKPQALDAWDCEMMFSTVDRAGESPWSYGLRFLWPKGAARLDVRYLSCPGTP